MMLEHKSRDDIWFAVHGKVYNVTKYLGDHPGGEEVLIDRGGDDATEDFEDVGHSREARKTLEPYEIGELPPSERIVQSESAFGGDGGGAGIGLFALPVLVIAVALGYFFFIKEAADAGVAADPAAAAT